MEVGYQRCCELDVDQASVVGCVRRPDTAALLQLADG